MTRVAVIGNAGTGKSTMSRRLGAMLETEVVHVDRLFWRPAWKPTPAAEFERAHAEAIARDRWIIDGVGSWTSVQARVAAADTVVFTDYPLWLCYWWATKRQISSLFKPRDDLPPDCPMLPMTAKMFRLIWHVHREIRPQLLELLRRAGDEGKRIVHLRSPKQMRAFLSAIAQPSTL